MPKLKVKFLKELASGAGLYRCKECKKVITERDLYTHALSHNCNTILVDTTQGK